METEITISVEEDLDLEPPCDLALSAEPPLTPETMLKPSANAHRHQKRRMKRVQNKPYGPSLRTLVKHVQPAEPILTNVNAEALPATRGAYRAKVDREKLPSKDYSPEELIAMGMQYIPWDGM